VEYRGDLSTIPPLYRYEVLDTVHTLLIVRTRMSLYCSIIICTCDRAKLLERALRSITGQDYPIDSLEVLVVDNDPKESAKTVAENVAREFPFPLRYISENQQGLSFARNTGVQNALGEILIFLDDDAYPQTKNWAKNLVSAFEDLQLTAAGGDLYPIWERKHKPEWLHSKLLAPLSLTSFKLKEITPLRYPIYPCGANIAFRKADIDDFTPFSLSLGWAQDNTMVPGEEAELCLRLARSGKKIAYVPNASVNHFISDQKLTEKWFTKRGYGQGVSFARIDKMHTPKLLIYKNLTYHVTMRGLSSTFAKIAELFRLRKYVTLFRFLNQRAKGYIHTITE